MSNNLQYLDSTLIDTSDIPCDRHPADFRSDGALVYTAREVFGLLQRSHSFPANRDNSSSETIDIRAAIRVLRSGLIR